MSGYEGWGFTADWSSPLDLECPDCGEILSPPLGLMVTDILNAIDQHECPEVS